MTTLKAVERLLWRFGSGNAFAPNTQDKQALNAIIDYVNDSQSYTETNQGFAKLYVWAFAELCRRYDADVIDEIPQKQLHKLLEKPLEYFISQFTQHLNRREQVKFLEQAGVVGKEYFLCSPEEKAERDALVLEAIKDPEKMSAFRGEIWKEEDVESMLMPQIAFALIKFKL